ncbi:MAG: tetratricopeptide repeat protein, partial [Candidatus Hodarchaeota archaeon]
MKQLHKALQDKITVDRFKKLLKSMLDELEQPTENIFNIFNENEENKYPLDYEPLEKYIEDVIELSKKYSETPYQNVMGKNTEFLEKLLNKTEKGSTLYRSIEDFIKEFNTGFFYSRYLKKGDVNYFIIYNFNKYLILLLEHRIKNLLPIIEYSIPFLQLSPEYYLNHVKLSELLYNSFIDLFNLPENTKSNKFSSLSIHFMSVLMALLFEEYSDDEKITILNNFYDFKVDLQDIKNIADNFEVFIEKTNYFEEKNEILKNKRNIFTNHLIALDKKFSNLELYQYSEMIYQYLYEVETDSLLKVKFLDNLATAKRDLGKFDEAIKTYEEVIDFYKQKDLFYNKFVALKNVAYCKYQQGNYEEAEQIFNNLEKNLTIYKKEELGNVYYNLAMRYRLIYQFEKEEYYLNLALENFSIDHPMYDDRQQRTIEIGNYFNLNEGKLDFESLRNLEIERNYNLNLRKAYTYQNNNNIELSKYFLKRAYKNKKSDFEYWRIIANNHIIKQEWNKLEKIGMEVLKLNPQSIYGHFYKCLFYINKKDNSNLLNHLLKMLENLKYDSFYMEAGSLERFENILHFICRGYSKKELESFIDYIFNIYNQKHYKKNNLEKIFLLFAKIFSFNNEKELSGYIFRRFMEINKSWGSYVLYGGWYYRFKEYNKALHYYKEALSLSPKNIEILERILRTYLIMDQFKESLYYLDKILTIVSGDLKNSFNELKNYIITLRDNKIRYEDIPLKDVVIIFNTVYHQLKSVHPSKEVEFGNVLTEISKGIENLIAKTLGKILYNFIFSKYPSIPKEIREGDGKSIKPINRLFLNFLDAPSNNIPTLGNWRYILRGAFENFNPYNPLMQEIYDFISQSPKLNLIDMKKILEMADLFLGERNYGTHSKLYTLEEVKDILKTITPLINDIISYLLNL